MLFLYFSHAFLLGVKWFESKVLEGSEGSSHLERPWPGKQGACETSSTCRMWGEMLQMLRKCICDHLCNYIWYVWVVWAIQLCTYRHTVHETCNWVFCCSHIFYACIAQRLWPGNNLQQLCKISVRLGQPDPSWTKNGSAPHPACELGD